MALLVDEGNGIESAWGQVSFEILFCLQILIRWQSSSLRPLQWARRATWILSSRWKPSVATALSLVSALPLFQSTS